MNYSNVTTSTIPFAPPVPPPVLLRVFAACISTVIITFGGIGNITILLAFARSRTLWKKQNIYLFCLTITDLLTSTLTVSGLLDEYLSGRWRFSQGLCRAFQVEIAITFIGSLYFVVLISRDRMLMVTKGSAYDAHESAARKWLLAALNIIILSILLIPYHSYDLFSGVSIFDPNQPCKPEQLQSLYVTIATQFTVTVLPLVLMLYYYARVRRYIKRAHKIAPSHPIAMQAPTTANITYAVSRTSPKPPGQSFGHNAAAPSGKAARAEKLLIVLLISVFQCALPATITSIVMNILMANPDMVTYETFTIWMNLNNLAFIWSCTANAANPILYAYAMPSYRKAAREVGQRVWRLISCSKK